jgi:adenylate kinase
LRYFYDEVWKRMAKGKIIVAVGLAGVGKSTVLKELRNLADKDNKNLVIVSYGTLMTEEAKKMKITDDRDSLRRSSIEDQKELQANAAKAIVKMSADWDYVIVDTHMIINTDIGYFPGLPAFILSILDPSLFVVIETAPEALLQRRIGDATRKRDIVSTEDLLTEITLSRAATSVCSVLTGAPAKFIENAPGKQAEAAAQFMTVIEGI